MMPWVARVAQFIRSLAVIALMTVVAPAVLVAATRARFGGSSPLTGVDLSGLEWSSFDRLLEARLSDDTIGDVVIRAAVIVCWLSIAVFAITVVMEAIHMRRHGGLHMPDVRSLGLAQRPARVVAAGLLVLLPSFGARSTASALDLPAASPVGSAVMFDQLAIEPPIADDQVPAPAAASPVVHRYRVRSGDSIYAIAERMAGPSLAEIDRYADQLIEINLGREVAPGHRFTNAAFVDVGWELELPSIEPAPSEAPLPPAAVHLVAPGESLWSIADDELGDGQRWPEIFEINRDRSFVDGGSFTNPRVIRPGWDLMLPPVGPPAIVPEGAVDPSVAETEPVVAVPAEPAAADVVEAPDEPTPEVPVVVVPAAAEHPTPVAPVPSPPEHQLDPPDRGPSPEPDRAWTSETPSAFPRAIGARAAGVGESAAAAPSPATELSVDGGAAETIVQPAAPELLTMRRAAMLSLGALLLVASRRRQRLRQAPPDAQVVIPDAVEQATERSLRLASADQRVRRVERSVQSVALDLAAGDARVLAVRCAPDGEIELLPSRHVPPTPPWTMAASGSRHHWRLPVDVTDEALADLARRVAAPPCPSLVQLGVDERGWDVYVDLEPLGVVHVAAPAAAADSIVNAVAATLSSSAMAEIVHLLSVDVDPEAFLGHRLHRAELDVSAAIAAGRRAVGAADNRTASRFELRARHTRGEMWEPAVVLVGSSTERWSCGALPDGVAVVSAAPTDDATVTLRPDGELWVLEPLGIRLQPIGLTPEAVGQLADLVAPAPPHSRVMTTPDADDTLYGSAGADEQTGVSEAAGTGERWSLMVRLLGPLAVVDRSGTAIAFERSKTSELIAWLATHRQRSTRSNARTALWEHDVRDATFANVVSEARRAMARCVAPPDGQEWVGRSLSESLPLHPEVVTDAELLERAMHRARSAGSPEAAIAVLGDAVRTIRGLPFEGTSFLWPDAEGITSHLTLVATNASAELAAHHLAIGDVEGVFAATAFGLQVLPGHEALIGLRMRAHAAAGDHAGVRHEWESYERMIAADPWSDGEPSPTLLELRSTLLRAGSVSRSPRPR